MFTFLLFFVTNEILVSPFSIVLPELRGGEFQSSVNLPEKNNYTSEQQLVQLRESDKNLLRAVAFFICALLVFSLITCLCAMYWCVCWTLHCPGVSTMRSMIRGSSDSFRTLRSVSRMSCVSLRKSKRRVNSDPPPAYEAIIIECSIEDVPPPTYSEALKSRLGQIDTVIE